MYRKWVTTGVVDLVFAFPSEYVQIQCALEKSVEGRLVNDCFEIMEWGSTVLP